MTRKIKVGIIGCGAIGSEIAKACQGGLKDKINLFAICDIDENKAAILNSSLNKKVAVLKLDEIIKGAGLIIEAASVKISGQVAEKCVKDKTDCMIMSVGGLIGKEKLLKLAEDRNVKIFMPSGAICGIDGLKSAASGRIDSVTLTTKKPIKGLQGAPYLKEKNIDLANVKEETVIFDGSASDAVKGFPQNVNVSATLSLAGIGSVKTRVRIMTSPAYTKNIHEIEIEGDFGRITTITENMPSGSNPKTSALAFLSAITTLKNITENVRIGT